MRQFLILLLIPLMCLLSACDAVEVSSAAIPQGLSTDYQNGELVASIQIASGSKPGDSSSSEPPFQVITGRGRSNSEAARRILLQLPRVPLWSQASIFLMGENLAKTDLSLFTDFLARNRNIRKNIPIFVTKGATPAEIFQVKPLIEPYPANAIKGILDAQHTQLGLYEPVEITELLQKLAAPGVDPVIPQVRIIEEDGKKLVTLDGLAVFHERKMVGSLNEDQSQGYRWVKPGMIQGGLVIIPSPARPDRHVTLELLRSWCKTRAEVRGNQVIMHIQIKAEGNYYEKDDPSELLTLEGLTQIENLGRQEIVRQIESCVAQARALDSDIFGWGAQVAGSNPREWKELESNWSQVFPHVETDLTVEFNIRRTYLAYRSFPIK